MRQKEKYDFRRLLISRFLSVLFMVFVYNAVVNIHTHIDESGHLLTHIHPFQNMRHEHSAVSYMVLNSLLLFYISFLFSLFLWSRMSTGIVGQPETAYTFIFHSLCCGRSPPEAAKFEFKTV